jgi:hypothetical protein
MKMENRMPGFKSLLQCLANDDPRPFTKAVLVESHDGAARFVATDGYIMGILDYPGLIKNIESIPQLTYFLSREAAELFYDACTVTNAKVTYESGGFLNLLSDSIIMRIKMETSEYLDYNDVVNAIGPNRSNYVSVGVRQRHLSILPAGYVCLDVPTGDAFRNNPISASVENGMFIFMQTNKEGVEYDS